MTTIQTGPAPAMDAAPSMAAQSVQRSLAEKYSTSADEVGRLIAAAIEVMRESDTDSPRVGDIVTTSGLSNQTFYRYFTSKDELLLAVLDNGVRRLLGYLSHDLDKHPSGIVKVSRWINGIMIQAMDPSAAAATRGVLANSSQLMYRFGEQFTQSEEVLKAPLRQALLTAMAQREIPTYDETTVARHVEAIYRMVMGAMQSALSSRREPTQDDIDHLVAFARLGLGGRDSVIDDRSTR